jgi:hypothetical protein
MVLNVFTGIYGLEPDGSLLVHTQQELDELIHENWPFGINDWNDIQRWRTRRDEFRVCRKRTMCLPRFSTKPGQVSSQVASYIYGVNFLWRKLPRYRYQRAESVIMR